MRSESAGGLKVKVLGWTPRDLGLSPSWHSNFSCSKFASRENYLLKQDMFEVKNKDNLYTNNKVNPEVDYFVVGPNNGNRQGYKC